MRAVRNRMPSGVVYMDSANTVESMCFGEEWTSASSLGSSVNKFGSDSSVPGASMFKMLTDTELRSLFDKKFGRETSDSEQLDIPVPNYKNEQILQRVSALTKRGNKNKFMAPLPVEIQTQLQRVRNNRQMKNHTPNMFKDNSNSASTKKVSYTDRVYKRLVPAPKLQSRAQPSYWLSFSYMRSNRSSIDMRVRQTGARPDLAMSAIFSKLTLEMTVYPSPNSAIKKTVTLKKSSTDNSFRTSFTTFPLSMDGEANQDGPFRVRYRVIVHRWLVNREVVAQWTDTLKVGCVEEIITQWHRVDFK